MKTRDLRAAVARAVEIGLAAAAVVDPFYESLAAAGALEGDDVPAILRTVTCSPTGEELVRRMHRGEMVEVSFNDRVVGVGMAARLAFVVVVFAEVTRSSRAVARALRREVELQLDGTRMDHVSTPPWTRGGGGSSSGPADLPVIEYGVTVPRRDRAKA